MTDTYCDRCDDLMWLNEEWQEAICDACQQKEFDALMMLEIEEAIGDARTWKARCHEISCALKDAFPEHFGKAVTRYGAYDGRVAVTSMFYGRPFIRHGWLEMPDGTIIDPTRWVFEDCKPYIYHGPNDEEYDNESQEFATMLYQQREVPSPDESSADIKIKFTEDVAKHVASLLQIPEVNLLNVAQVHYLGVTPVNLLQPYAKEIVLAMIDAGQGAWVPMGTRNLALNTDSLGRAIVTE